MISTIFSNLYIVTNDQLSYSIKDSDEINQLLIGWPNGNLKVEAGLIDALNPQVLRVTHNQFKSNQADSLQTTETVNQAFINLRDQQSLVFKTKQQFFVIAATVIRNVVVDHFRSESRRKRGDQMMHLTLDRLAEIMGVSESVASRNWKLARLWLMSKIAWYER